MKKNWLNKIGAAAVVLTVVTATMLSGTLAKYTSEVTGTGSVALAKWEFKANDGETAFTIDPLKQDGNTGVADGKIVPGDAGKFSIDLSNADSDVAVDYKITVAGLPEVAGLTFKYGDKAIQNGTTITGTMLKGTASSQVEVGWEFAEGTTYADVKTAAEAGAASFTFTVAGEQNATATAAAGPTVADSTL